MTTLVILSATLIVASTTMAEAKRFRFSSPPASTSSAQPSAAAPTATAPAPKPSAPVARQATTTGGGVVFFSTTSVARPQQPAQDPAARQPGATPSQTLPSPAPIFQEASNPNARPLAVLGQGASVVPANATGTRGFSTVN